MRPRLDGSYMEGAVWSAPHEIATLPYGAPVILPMYSDERTGQGGLTPCVIHLFNWLAHILALSGDFPQHSKSLDADPVGLSRDLTFGQISTASNIKINPHLLQLRKVLVISTLLSRTWLVRI